MSTIFAITAASARVQLDPARRAEVAFTVSNRSGCALRARLLTRVQEGAYASWLTLDGELERELAVDATVQVRVMVAVPAQTPAGSYAFRLDVVGVANPDEHVSAGQWVALEVPVAQHEEPSHFPWWLLLIAAGVVAVAGIGLTLGLHQWWWAAIGGGVALLLGLLAFVIRVQIAEPPPVNLDVASVPQQPDEPPMSVQVEGPRAAPTSTAVPTIEVDITPVAPVTPVPSPPAPARPAPTPRVEPPAKPAVSASAPAAPVSAPAAPAPATAATPAVVSSPAPTPAVGRPPAPLPPSPATARMIMPRLVGWQQQDAAKALAALGLVLGPIERQPSGSPAGTVLDHRPSERQPIAKGDLAILVIAAPRSEGGQP